MRHKKNKNSWSFRGILLMLLLLLPLVTGCSQKKAEANVVIAPKVEEEKSVVADKSDEEQQKLIEAVRDYAENFAISEVEEAVKKLIKASVPSGSSAEASKETILAVVTPFMEEKLRLKVSEGLDEIAGSHIEQDVDMIYNRMDTTALINFIVEYEMELLKIEGYLR